MSDKPTNMWGNRYTVQRIGHIHQAHFKSQRQAMKFALAQHEEGGDWFVAKYDKIGRSKIIFRTDRC